MMCSYQIPNYQSLPSPAPIMPAGYQPASIAVRGDINLGTYMMQHQKTVNAPVPFCPPIFHPPNKPYKVSVVDKMTVPETARWIKTLAAWKGWSEGELYSKSFKENSISGRMLQHLNEELLEFDLGITRHGHRQEILSTIKGLFPASFPSTSTIQSGLRSSIGIPVPESDGSTWGGIRYAAGSENESSTQYPASIYSSLFTDREESVQMDNSDFMSDSCYSKSSLRTVTESEERMFSRRSSTCGSMTSLIRPSKPLRGKSLHLLCDAHTTRDTNVIKKRFHELNYTVNVRPSGDHYIVSFQNYLQAKHALQRAQEIGYRLVMRPRATPKCPASYVCVSKCKIREGKSLNGNIVGYLEKGQRVTVNQLKGRRARLIGVNRTGDTVKIGWVTTKTQEGIELIKRVDNDDKGRVVSYMVFSESRGEE